MSVKELTGSGGLNVPKHRQTVFTVIREELVGGEIEQFEGEDEGYTFSAAIGTYHSLNRAEEVVGLSAQALRDAGVPDGLYRFSLKVNTYYDE